MKHSPSRLIATTMILALAACAAKSTPTPTPPEPPPVEKAAPAEPVAEASPEATPATPATPTRDLIDTADELGNFTMLIKLVEEAGLTNALREDGPLTLFAPDDAAFAKLAEGELEKLQKDKKSLAALLNYHVLPGRAIKSVELGTMPTAKTAAGPELTIEAADGAIKINGTVMVTKADVLTTNGVIHVVDFLLTPQPKKKGKKAK